MKHLFRFAFVLALLFSVPRLFLFACEENEGLPMQELREGEIISSVQSILNSKTLKCEVIGLVSAPIERVWDVICDYNSYDRLMPRTPTAFLVHPKILTIWQDRDIKNWNQFEKSLADYKIPTCEDNPAYFYSRFKMPWPLQDRCFVLKTEQFPEIFKSQWVEIIGNTDVNEGSWELTSLENDSEMTLAVYTLYIDPGIALPKKILQTGMKGISEIMRSLRLRVADSAQTENPSK